jgi:hypothetical protein
MGAQQERDQTPIDLNSLVSGVSGMMELAAYVEIVARKKIREWPL